MNIKKNIHISTYKKKIYIYTSKRPGCFFGSDNVKKKKIRFDINKVYSIYCVISYRIKLIFNFYALTIRKVLLANKMYLNSAV